MSERPSEVSFLWRAGILAGAAVLGILVVCVLQPDCPHDAYISSGSMATAFWGPSFRVTCGSCGFRFRCDAEKAEFIPTDHRAVCPNCGYGNNSLTRQNLDTFGQQVKFATDSPGCWAPRRWNPVAFKKPGASSRVGIKRVVGLPNEWIEIRHGDIYADGRLVQKPLSAQRQLSVPVYESEFRPFKSPWRPLSENSRWMPTDTGFYFGSTNSARAVDTDWLEYHNLPTEPLARGVERPDDAPINDNSGYNQGISRQLNDMNDVMLSCWLRLTGGGNLVLAANDGGYSIEIIISPRTQIMSVKIEGDFVQRTRIPSMMRRSRKLEFSLFDQQCLVAIDGRAYVELPLPAQLQRRPSSRPFRIGAKNVRVWMNQLRICRDIYYLNDRGLALNWRADQRLGADEYFLLGDNPPISQDSRHWSPPGVARKLLLGKVLRTTKAE